jgi:hypothetical protein
MKTILEKLYTEQGDEVRYFIKLNDEKVCLNDFIGQQITMQYFGKITCSSCSKITDKSFGQGFCYTCFNEAPEASPCIINPELCEAHLGLGRDVEYEERNHNQPHFVYFAATDKVKIGITRNTQIPTRWIDQGAQSAIILAETPNRYTAGIIEVALKEAYDDKTNWQSMLKDLRDESIDLVEEKWLAQELLPHDLAAFFTEDEFVHSINYPVKEYPSTLEAMNFDKMPLISGKLTGIRAQYFYIDGTRVINIRRHTGYEVDIILGDGKG